MPATPRGPEGDISPGDLAERELDPEAVLARRRADPHDLEQAPVDDREPKAPVPATPSLPHEP